MSVFGLLTEILSRVFIFNELNRKLWPKIIKSSMDDAPGGALFPDKGLEILRPVFQVNLWHLLGKIEETSEIL